MMRFCLLLLCLVFCLQTKSQDSIYARQIIKKLTSKKLLGRGYVNNGVNKAALYLSKELKQIGVMPFGKSFSQQYSFSVNTFPTKMNIVLDGKTLVAGKEYLIYPSAKSTKATYTLYKTDSLTYKAKNITSKKVVDVKLKKKLTYTVATEVNDNITIELLKDSFPNDLKTLSLDFENKFIPNFTCQNLCGYIKGTQQPDSFLVITAHYDHLGAMGKQTYFPGANDNASGVSMLLNLAKYYKAHPPKYSVAFILFSGEEAGLLGSKYYSENPVFPLSNIKFLTNVDLLGTGEEGITVVNATIFEKQFKTLLNTNEKQHYVKQIKQRGKAANSDHYWFTEKGVPSFFIYTMGGISAYHDVYDVEKTLPLTDYVDVCNLIIDFFNAL